MPRPPIPIALGDRFGRLVVLAELPSQRRPWGDGSNRMLRCRCDCGAERIVRLANLRTGNTSSCGCYSRQRSREWMRTHRDWFTYRGGSRKGRARRRVDSRKIRVTI